MLKRKLHFNTENWACLLTFLAPKLKFIVLCERTHLQSVIQKSLTPHYNKEIRSASFPVISENVSFYYRVTTVSSARLLTCFWMYTGGMWVCLIIYSLCLSSQCACVWGVVSDGRQGNHTALELLYYKAHTQYRIGLLYEMCQSYAILVSHAGCCSPE